MASSLMTPGVRSPALVGRLGTVAWVVLCLSAVIGFAVEGTSAGDLEESLLFVTSALFFAVIVARLSTVMWHVPERRVAVAALTVGVVLWGAGSILLNASGSATTAAFPATGEWLFLSSYVGMAAFLVLDAGDRHGRAATAWLDAIIVCGGAAALASAILLTPFTAYFPQGGVPLLVALIYPALDLALAVVVLGQMALATRSWSSRTLSLMAGFVVFAIADSTFVLNLGTGPYAFNVSVIVLWALALMLITDAACRPRPPLVSRSRRLPSSVLVASFIVSIGLLLARPSGVTGLAIALPAVITLVATAARLTVALRESQAAAEAFHLARTDDLTGLPNRRALLREVDRHIRHQEPLGLMLLGLDGFKEVNDTLGHSAGDTLLAMVSVRIRDSLPKHMTMARVGGDEFAILVPDEDPVLLLERAQAIRHALLAPARIDGLDLAMPASLGIAIREPTDTKASDLLRRADVAMYEAKVSRSGAVLYTPQKDEFSRERLQMAEELRRALRDGHVTVWYQPKVDAFTGRVAGVEALVRWQHPQRGLLSPLEFLPVARRAGLMQELSEVVVGQAVAAAARWYRTGLALNVAINVAPPELLAGQLLPIVYDAMTTVGIPAHWITIEVTEDTFLANPQRAHELLLDVRSHGLKTSIDDYGTGFSSLAYLRDLPVSELKMDRSFVAQVCADDRSRLIVASTTDMAHALDLLVVAEGVEDAEIAAEVTAIGVDVLQGYHISAPMPEAQVDAWVRRWNRPSPPVHIVHTRGDPQTASMDAD